jgi:membrane fusion protein (multidrug efflux system)
MKILRVRGSFLFTVASCVALSFGCSKDEKVVAAPPPPEVRVATVLHRDVPVYVEAIGELRGNTEIEIRARVEGFVESVDYKEGTFVEKGAPLYTIDARPFEAKLAATKANQAQMEAELSRAHQDVARYEPLVAKNAISREEYETAVQVEKAAIATVAAAKAVVDQAQIDVGYCKVIAPESGLAGRTEVYAGTLVGRGQSTLLTRISRTDPIHVRFSFPERDYLTYARKKAERGAPEKESAEFELVLPDGTVLPVKGKLVFVDRNVDATTGTIMAEAEFANADQILRPGQYARVRARIGERKGAVLVPQRCVQELQGIFSVMVLGAGDTVEQRIVTPAERQGSLWVIPSGLEASERVVVDGLQRVRPGSKVSVKTVLLDENGKDASASEGAAAKATEPAPAGKHEKATAKEPSGH